MLFLIALNSLRHQAPMKKQACMNNLTTKKQMQKQTWWALVGTRNKLRSKVKFFNFLPFSRLINFVRQRRKTVKNVGSGTQTIAPIKQAEKSLGLVGSVFFITF